jgi:hypothetical protein
MSCICIIKKKGLEVLLSLFLDEYCKFSSSRFLAVIKPALMYWIALEFQNKHAWASCSTRMRDLLGCPCVAPLLFKEKSSKETI